jgi:hypothetical protein
MNCDACLGIPLDLFQISEDSRYSIQYKLHGALIDFAISAAVGCHSCKALLEQRRSRLGLSGLNADADGESYWIEWDNDQDALVLASGWNHYYLEYEAETGLRTRSNTTSFKHYLY